MVNTHKLVLVLSVAMAALSLVMMVGPKVAAGQQGCQGDLQGLVTQCAMYVQKAGPVVDPSPACCNVVRATDVQCACRFITADVEAVIDMAKVVHVAEFCGKPLDHGAKCGSYTVP